VLPTGCGKTVVFSRVAEARVRLGRRVLVLAHRTELIEQGRRRMLADTQLDESDVGIEQGDRRALDGHRVVVGSVQSLRGARLKKYDPASFQTIIVDEAHHAPATTYRAIFEHFAGAERLGVTATPDRLDGAGLGRFFKAAAYVYEIRDAIGERYLVPVRARMVFIESIDLSRVRTTAGDLNEGDLETVMLDERALHGIAKPAVELTGERPTLVFAANVAHARALADTINGYAPGQAVAVDATTDAAVRRQTLKDYERRQFRFLVNCALYTEGVDLPLVGAIVMARPTESRALYAQMAGRGTRLLGRTWEESLAAGKSDCLILDMVGNAGRHRLVCALDVLDGTIDEKVKQRAAARYREEEVDVMDALDRGHREELVQQRLDLVAQVRYRVVDVEDQFVLLNVRPAPGRWGGVAATDKQLEVLKSLKIKGYEKLDRGQASDVIGAAMARRERGLCTVAQAGILLRNGINPDLPFDRAREIIDAIKSNGWRGVPASIIASDPDLVLTGEAMAAKRRELDQ
jgi:superfamily II DNA or RNA helicase